MNMKLKAFSLKCNSKFLSAAATQRGFFSRDQRGLK
jgi:hypothetical protein